MTRAQLGNEGTLATTSAVWRGFGAYDSYQTAQNIALRLADEDIRPPGRIEPKMAHETTTVNALGLVHSERCA